MADETSQTAHQTFARNADWAARELANVEFWKDEKGAEIKLRACKMILENAGFTPQKAGQDQPPLAPADIDRLEKILQETNP